MHKKRIKQISINNLTFNYEKNHCIILLPLPVYLHRLYAQMGKPTFGIRES